MKINNLEKIEILISRKRFKTKKLLLVKISKSFLQGYLQELGEFSTGLDHDSRRIY